MEVAQHWRLKSQRYNMAGSVCSNCGAMQFPPRENCNDCAQDSTPPRDEIAAPVQLAR